MLELPYDIWRLITDYLPVEQVRTLYPVNRGLFNVAMDERYKDAYVGLLHSSPQAKDIGRFRDPSLAFRARTLRISKGSLHKMLVSMEREACRSSLNRAMRAILVKGNNGSLRRKADPVEEAVCILPQLISVTKLFIELNTYEYPTSHRSIHRLFTQGWTILADRLTSLSITSPVEDIGSILPVSTTLSCLHTFSIRLHMVFRTTDANAHLQRTLLPFLHVHRSTIRDLTLQAWEESINMSSLLQQMPHMPFLNSLDLTHQFTSMALTDFSGHHPFFLAHHTSLKSLALHFTTVYALLPSPEVFFAQNWCQVSLPQLDSLKLYFPVQWNEGLINYVHQFASSLTSVVVQSDTRCLYDRAAIFISKFAEIGRLRHLQFNVYSLSPDLLALLAQKLPHLHSLKLVYSYILPHKDEMVAFNNRSHLFCEAMQHHSDIFSKWKLYSFDHSPINMWNGDNHKYRKAFVENLPNVQYFCGLGREAYEAGSDNEEEKLLRKYRI